MQYQSLSPNIGVESVEETVTFYTEFLNFREVMSVPANDGKLVWAMINAGSVNLMFQDKLNIEEEYPQLKGRSLQAVFTFYIKMKNVDQLYEQVVSTDYLVKTKHITTYGIEEFAIKDNNGLILTIAEDTQESTLLNYDNFFLPVDDYELSKKYYTDTLGLKIKFEFAEQGMVAFNIGNEEPAIILKDKKKFKGIKPTIWLEVANVRSLYKQLIDKGVNFITEPFPIRTGWAVEFNDPSGNILGFADYLKS